MLLKVVLNVSIDIMPVVASFYLLPAPKCHRIQGALQIYIIYPTPPPQKKRKKRNRVVLFTRSLAHFLTLFQILPQFLHLFQHRPRARPAFSIPHFCRSLKVPDFYHILSKQRVYVLQLRYR